MLYLTKPWFLRDERAPLWGVGFVCLLKRNNKEKTKRQSGQREITTNGGNHNGNVNDVWTRETVGRKRSIKGGMKQLDETFILF